MIPFSMFSEPSVFFAHKFESTVVVQTFDREYENVADSAPEEVRTGTVYDGK